MPALGLRLNFTSNYQRRARFRSREATESWLVVCFGGFCARYCSSFRYHRTYKRSGTQASALGSPVLRLGSSVAPSPRLIVSHCVPSASLPSVAVCLLMDQTWVHEKKGSPAGTFVWTQTRAPPCIRPRSRRRPRRRRELPPPPQRQLPEKICLERDTARARARTTGGAAPAVSTRKAIAAATTEKVMALAATAAVIVIEAPRTRTDTDGGAAEMVAPQTVLGATAVGTATATATSSRVLQETGGARAARLDPVLVQQAPGRSDADRVTAAALTVRAALEEPRRARVGRMAAIVVRTAAAVGKGCRNRRGENGRGATKLAEKRPSRATATAQQRMVAMEQHLVVTAVSAGEAQRRWNIFRLTRARCAPRWKRSRRMLSAATATLRHWWTWSLPVSTCFCTFCGDFVAVVVCCAVFLDPVAPCCSWLFCMP